MNGNNDMKKEMFSKYDVDLSLVLEQMHHELSTRHSVSDYARQMNLSTSRFAHIFKKTIGIAPIQYRNIVRMNHAKHLLLTTRKSVTEISLELGYSDVAIFSKRFKEITNLSPSEYRESQKNRMEGVLNVI